MLAKIMESLQLLVETSLSEINTQTPGVIVSFDAAKNRAVVKPSMPKSLSDGSELDAPQIVEVPIVWTGNSKGSFTYPLEKGDNVMLVFQQRSLEGWLSGNTDAPDDPRQFDLSDCVAIPGCGPGGTADPTDVVLKFHESEVRIKPDNTVSFGNENGSITISPSGDITLKGNSVKIDTPANAYNLENHKHKDTQAQAGSFSGTPVT